MIRRNFLHAALALLAAPAACLARRKPPSTGEGTLAPGWSKDGQKDWTPRRGIFPALVTSAITPIARGEGLPYGFEPGSGIARICRSREVPPAGMFVWDEVVRVQSLKDDHFPVGSLVQVLDCDNGTYFLI